MRPYFSSSCEAVKTQVSFSSTRETRKGVLVVQRVWGEYLFLPPSFLLLFLTPFPLPPSFLPSFLAIFLPFFPSFPSSFLPPFLSFLATLPPRQMLLQVMCSGMGRQNPGVNRGSRNEVWESECGENHGEAGGKEKDELNLCMISETHLCNHDKGLEN